MAIRVLIADDHTATRRALSLVLSLYPDIDVVGEAADGREAVRVAADIRPDLVLMDGKMPIMDGLEATRLIKSRWPEIRVIVLTMSAEYQAKALTAGADTSLLKDRGTADVLHDAILES
jgi:DNA-binding NarL/FixJ family response regulator